MRARLAVLLRRVANWLDKPDSDYLQALYCTGDPAVIVRAVERHLARRGRIGRC